MYQPIALFLALGVAASALALDPDKSLTQYIHESWQMDRGLPQNSVLAIEQTSDGYLWLGTFGGLARFDGVRFEVFNRTDTPKLTQTGVWALREDRRGKLWIGTNGGGLLCRDRGTFSVYSVEDGLSNNHIGTLLEDSNGGLWIGTWDGVTYLKDGVFTAYTSASGLPRGAVWDLAEDDEGAIWVAIDGGGVSRIADGEISVFDTTNGLPTMAIRSLMWDASEGVLLAGTLDASVICYRNESWQPLSSLGGMPTDVREIFKDRDGNLWIGTGHSGLFRLSQGRMEVISEEDGLTDRTIEILHEDREGSLWIATYRGGLNRLRDGQFLTYTEREGLSEDRARSVFTDSTGGVWIGTAGGGANCFHDGQAEVVSIREGLSGDQILSFGESRDGAVWIGTNGNGLNRWQDGEVTTFDTSNGLSDNIIRAVSEDHDGNIWVGTNRNGVDIIRVDGLIEHLTTADGLSSDSIYVLLQDSSGMMWIGTYDGGLNRYHQGSIESFGVAEGLSSAFVWSLTEDEKRPGAIWIGTNRGLNRYEGGGFSSYTVQDGLHDDTVFSVLDDSQGHLWMSSNRGIFSVSKAHLEAFDRGALKRISCVSYGRSEGMRTFGCNGPSAPAGAKDRAGRMWFPTTKGVVIVRPGDLPTNDVIPPVLIERLVVDDVDIDVDTGSPIVLEPGARRFVVHYTGLSLLAPEKVRFRFRLDGLHDQWIEAGARREAYFDSLAPSRYTFRVIACNNDGLWNETGAALEFVLLPHFYQTRLFYAACGLGAFLLGTGVVMGRVRQLKRRERVLSRLVAERTQELARANEELERLAHLDGLTGIANHRYFDRIYYHEWRRCLRNAKAISVIMIDVDFFKRFNDCYGHQAGDECLRKLAAVLEDRCHRPGDLAARYGGEEFVLVLSGTPEVGAAHVASEVLEQVEQLGIPHADGADGGVVTVSVGIATTVPRPETDPAWLIGCADEALYEAKRRGRNRAEVWAAPHATDKT
ncbi:MAG: diguanylate cyclase [bacterium]|nr:diguanylate cyclase [bacterium]